MAHYAFINQNNIVTEVIVGIDESNTDDLPEGYTSWEDWYLTQRPASTACKRTSYNTIANAHSGDGTAFRGNYAGIGYTYDTENDVFIAPQPYDSWTLNTSTWVWEGPIPYPDDGNDYLWDEVAYQTDNSTGWVLA